MKYIWYFNACGQAFLLIASYYMGSHAEMRPLYLASWAAFIAMARTEGKPWEK